jgi:UDP-GlcNAc:undecaprenyl-phosphate/decaprenyl-phosphate GlcNAc-1-phosphate transferase
VTPRVEAFLIVGAVTTVVTLVATPLSRRLALRTGVIVAPDERRVHARPTPLLAGLAMGIGLLAGMLTASQLEALDDIFLSGWELGGVVIAAVFMLLVGTVDDIREVSPPAKTAGTVLCAAVLVFSGVSLNYFRIPFGGVIDLDPNWSFLLSVLWVVGMTHAINLIDGLDGLAAGIVAIAASAFFIYANRLVDAGTLLPGNIAPLLVVIIVGLCAGYLPFNWHPAKVFMGDGGALLLGLLMAAATMVVGGRIGNEVATPGSTYFFFAPLFIPLVILGVPILDTALSIVRRVASHKGATTADKDHIHHRLVRLGHGQRRAVGILWSWTFLLSALALERSDVVVPVVMGAVGLIIYTVWPRLRPRRPAPPPAPAAEVPPPVDRPAATNDDLFAPGPPRR